LKDVTTVGDGYGVELILCTVMGIETALIKERESRLYFLVNDYKDVYRLVRLQCLITQEKLNIANTANIAYIPTKVA